MYLVIICMVWKATQNRVSESRDFTDVWCQLGRIRYNVRLYASTVYMNVVKKADHVHLSP
jgi:hypothetical protein